MQDRRIMQILRQVAKETKSDGRNDLYARGWKHAIERALQAIENETAAERAE